MDKERINELIEDVLHGSRLRPHQKDFLDQTEIIEWVARRIVQRLEQAGLEIRPKGTNKLDEVWERIKQIQDCDYDPEETPLLTLEVIEEFGGMDPEKRGVAVTRDLKRNPLPKE